MDITTIKRSQRKIVITGDEGFNDGSWHLEIFDFLGNPEFDFQITDNEKDFTFEEFIKEALELYNKERKEKLKKLI
jgi:hypothetical protein